MGVQGQDEINISGDGSGSVEDTLKKMAQRLDGHQIAQTKNESDICCKTEILDRRHQETEAIGLTSNQQCD